MAPDELVAALRAFLDAARDEPLLPLMLIGAFLPWGAIFVSPWLLVLQVGVLLPAPLSCGIAWLGMMLSATVYYGIGRLLGGPLVKRFLGERATRLVAGASLEGIVLVRAVPLLPYTAVNLTAGAFRMRFIAYLIGTALGIAPLVLVVTLVGERAIDAITHPTPTSIALFVLALVVAAGVSIGARRVLKKRAATPRAP